MDSDLRGAAVGPYPDKLLSWSVKMNINTQMNCETQNNIDDYRIGIIYWSFNEKPEIREISIQGSLHFRAIRTIQQSMREDMSRIAFQPFKNKIMESIFQELKRQVEVWLEEQISS